jgi:hypothetical protein
MTQRQVAVVASVSCRLLALLPSLQ